MRRSYLHRVFRLSNATITRFVDLRKSNSGAYCDWYCLLNLQKSGRKIAPDRTICRFVCYCGDHTMQISITMMYPHATTTRSTRSKNVRAICSKYAAKSCVAMSKCIYFRCNRQINKGNEIFEYSTTNGINQRDRQSVRRP